MWPNTGSVVFGPAPLSRDLKRDWLSNTVPSREGKRGPRVLADPPPFERTAPASTLTWPFVSHPRSTRLHESRRLPPRCEQRRLGPCEERHLPLDRHEPKNVQSGQKQAARHPWLPTREWQSTPRSHGGTASADGAAAWVPVPLSGFSARVVNDCEPSRGVDAVDAPAGSWSGQFSMHPPRTGATLGHEPGEAAWPLEVEATRWRQRAAGLQGRPLGTMAIVDGFLAGPLARNFLPEMSE